MAVGLNEEEPAIAIDLTAVVRAKHLYTWGADSHADCGHYHPFPPPSGTG